jgi:Family of unknown function (DUF6152)
MRNTLSRLIALLAVFGVSATASAHHGFSVEFDGAKCMDLRGNLTGIDWENPHAYLQMDVKDPEGKTASWHLEMITPNALKRNGTTRQDFLENMNKPMAARACPAKAGDNRAAAEYIKLSDNVLRIVGQLPERNITPEKLSFYNEEIK